MNISQTVRTAIACAATTAASVPAFADIITQERSEIPFGSFVPGRSSLQHGSTLGTATPIFQQTQSWQMSEQTATLTLQTAIAFHGSYITNSQMPSFFQTHNITLNVSLYDADTFDAANPSASLLSYQAINTANSVPVRVGNYSFAPVYSIIYDFQMPFMEQGHDPRRLLIAFAPEAGANSDQFIFHLPVGLRSQNSPGYLAEGPTDWELSSSNPGTLEGWGQAPNSARVPFSMTVETIPSPGTAALCLTAAAFGASFRRRK